MYQILAHLWLMTNSDCQQRLFSSSTHSSWVFKASLRTAQRGENPRSAPLRRRTHCSELGAQPRLSRLFAINSDFTQPKILCYHCHGDRLGPGGAKLTKPIPVVLDSEKLGAQLQSSGFHYCSSVFTMRRSRTKRRGSKNPVV